MPIIVGNAPTANYNRRMIELLRTRAFDRWLSRLRDERAKARIVERLRRVAQGNLGDVKPVGGGVSEMRIDYGPGYRIYFTRRGAFVVLLLIGGDKGSQQRDIATAKALALELKE